MPPSNAAPSAGASDRSLPVADQGSDQIAPPVGATAADALALAGGVGFDVDDLLSWAAGAQAAGMRSVG